MSRAVFHVLSSRGFQVVQTVSPEVGDLLADAMSGRRHGTEWVPPQVEIVTKDEDGRPLAPFDVALLGFAGLGFILTRHAVETIGGFLRDYGEILQLSCEQAELYAFNATMVLPALDAEKSVVRRFADGRLYAVRKYAFYPAQVSQEVFRITGMRISDVYFTDRAVNVWKASQLRGIEFQEVWRDADA